MIERQVTGLADDPGMGMTLGELASFVQEAMRADLPEDSLVRVRTGWHSQIQKLVVPR